MGIHKATAGAWRNIRNGAAEGLSVDQCLMELCHRIGALELQAQPQPQPQPTTPPQGLVEQVRLAIETSSIEQEPRAAIRAVAAWLRDHRARGGSAFELEQEAGQ
jgi:hypothetical protein